MTVSNSKIFPELVFNYSRDFPFIWEEMVIPIGFEADREQAEAILLAAAEHFGMRPEAITQDHRNQLATRYGIELPDLTGWSWRCAAWWARTKSAMRKMA